MNLKTVNLSAQQQKHLKDLIVRYNKQTIKSKHSAQTYRPVLADSRGTNGFCIETKEMLYPILGDRFEGARFWDVDGNEYIDIAMGFGVHLLGHRVPCILKALENSIENGLPVGPQAKLAGNVAELFCELTGMERVCFCNSGTEAVMTALRVVRAATGRSKIVMFKGSYHGHFDGTLAQPTIQDGHSNPKAVPKFPGVLQPMVDDVLVLTYGDSQSLDIIKTHASELAAVLVEPVQSRQPHLQPKEFLQQLRQLTQELGIALIFDEVITGFRVHPGGTQAWFGVKADIATYGKALGGGMPIGAVAGAAAYLDVIDGGHWSYGDASYPQVEKTFYAGAFCKHPLTMVTTQALLQLLKEQGPGLQEELNQRTAELANQLNSYFQAEEIPIELVYFGSMFRFALVKDSALTVFIPNVFQPLELNLLFYHLILKGIYCVELRLFFLSTAHTSEDIDQIVKAVKDSVRELRAGGFLLKTK